MLQERTLQFLSQEDEHCPPIHRCAPATDLQFTPRCTAHANVANAGHPAWVPDGEAAVSGATEACQAPSRGSLVFAKTKSVLGLISLFDVGGSFLVTAGEKNIK